VLADSLRFSLELEGFTVGLCDELTLFPSLAPADRPRCLVLDQDVFDRLIEARTDRLLAQISVPVVLLAGTETRRLLAHVNAASIAKIVEKPLLGRALLDAVRDVIEGGADASNAVRRRNRNFPPAPPPT
jgi:FixJ family two-component response regulator